MLKMPTMLPRLRSRRVWFPGGGCALLYASQVLKGMNGDNEDESAGIRIVYRALSAPARKIVSNAGLNDSELVVAKLAEGDKKEEIFDAKERKYVNAFSAGIIDPTKIVRTALQSAASVAAAVVTTETMIYEKPEEKSSTPPMAGGMGGMGGMGGF